MSSIILKYPEDPTGLNPNNLVINEPHDLGAGRNRAFVPNYGSYFTESMIVTEAVTNRVLTKGVHYIAAQLQQDASMAMDKEICAVVIIIDPTVRDSLLLTYQVVGGVFSTSATALAKMIETLDIDERIVEWGAIIGKPTAFPPAPHLHDIGDIYGFEYLVEALDALRNAILIGDEAAHDELRQYIRYEDGLLRDSITALDGRFQAHVQDHENPHATTKGQVGLGLVDNYATATQPEAEAGTLNNRFMTPLRTAQAIAIQALVPLNQHKADQSNPHNTTKAQVGLSLVDNYATATQPEAEVGVLNTRFMTPLRTAQAIAAQALVPLNAHINDKGNPHQTTKQQVGLGNLPNAITDSRAENNSDTVLSGKGMYDHTKSGDHDDRYVRINAAVSGSVKVESGIAYVYVVNTWQQFWPPLWQ